LLDSLLPLLRGNGRLVQPPRRRDEELAHGFSCLRRAVERGPGTGCRRRFGGETVEAGLSGNARRRGRTLTLADRAFAFGERRLVGTRRCVVAPGAHQLIACQQLAQLRNARGAFGLLGGRDSVVRRGDARFGQKRRRQVAGGIDLKPPDHAR
jgi:hypothetical protein